MENRTASLKVSLEVWEEIKNRKRLGDSTDTILRRALKLPEKHKEA